MYKALALTLCVLVVANAAGLRSSSDETFFKDWMKRHNRNYENVEEYMKRFNSWMTNYQYVLRTNSEQDNFRVHLNEFADMDNEEFRFYYTGLIPRREPVGDVKILSTDDLPATVDWVSKGAVTNVKNQGQCGSCWAFSTTGSLEGLHFLKKGSLLSFSEQQLVDCSGSYGNLGCNGGLMDNAFQYVEAKGIELESTYPYTAEDGTCQYDASQVVFKNTGYQDVAQDNEDQLQAAVAQQPVSVAVDGGSSAFQLYSGGVLTSYCGTQLDHGVLAVGYGTSSGQKYWKVKNSWGAGWGESGYIRLKRTDSDDQGECGIAMQPSYPTLN